MLKAATVWVAFSNHRWKICDDLWQQLAIWNSDHWGNIFEAAQGAKWPRSCILGQTASTPPSTGGNERQTYCVGNISEGKTQQMPHFSQRMHLNKHKNSFLCQSSATQLSDPDPDPAPGYHCNHASIYSPALHPQIGLYFVRLPSILLPDCPVPTAPVPDSAASSASW